MGRLVRFAGQSISIGLCWGSDEHCGALYELATGFNVWTYFKNLDNFSEASKVVRFKTANNDVILAIGYEKHSDSIVELKYNYAGLDGNGDPIYLASDVALAGLQTMGHWAGEAGSYHSFSVNSLYDDDDYRASIFFYDYDWQMAVLDYHGTGPTYAQGTMTCFNGYSLVGGAPEPLDSIQINQGMIYPENSTTMIPDIDRPVYKYNGQSTSHEWLPDLMNNTQAEIVQGYEEDSSTTGGGPGTHYGYQGEPVDFWGLPGLSALDTGFIRMYSPTGAQMRAFGSFLWSSSLIDNILKLMEDPVDAIIQVGIVPLDLSGYLDPVTSIKVGNVSSGAQAQPLKQQVIIVDLGSLNVKENWQNALDYSPFTKCELFLPMIGFVPMQTNEIMDATITLKYYVDLLSGDCLAALKVDKVSKNGINLHSVMYHYRGNLLLNIPITGKNYSSFYSTILTSAVGASTGSPGAIASGVSNVLNAVPQMQKSGAFTGAAGWIGCYTPYLAIDRPIQQLPSNYKKYVGYPSYIPYKLSDLSGYTMVDALIDNTVKATDAEKEEIERLLKEGVYL